MQGTRYYMKDEVPFSDFPAYTERSKGRSKAAAVFLAILVLLAAGLSGLYFLGKNKDSKSQTVVTPTESPLPTDAPTPTATDSASLSATPSGKLTPTPSGTSSKLDRSSINLVVLNGSGVVGAGRKYSTYLSGLGYNVTSTGNADTFDYTGITVKVKKSKSDFGALLKKDLTSFASGSAVTTKVDDTITTDAAVIVGK